MNKIFFCGVDWHCANALENFLNEKDKTVTVDGFLIGQSFVDYKILAPIKKFVKKFILPSKRFFKGYPMVSLFDIDKDDIIIVSIPDREDINQIHPKALEIYNKFIDLGYKETYIFCSNKFQYNRYSWYKEDFSYQFFLNCICFSPKKWGDSVFPCVEMHVVEWCNLNCKGCTHYSAIFEHSFPKLQDRISDLKKLKNKVSHIIQLRIMGGEPFLNPELAEYIIQSRKILPNSRISIVTNGLLIPKLDKKIFKVIKENDIFIDISEYEPTRKMKNAIEECLKQNNVKYQFARFDEETNCYSFTKPFSLSQNTKHKRLCFCPIHADIWNGKVARCAPLMYIDKLNKTFGTSLPDEGIIDLDSDISGKEFITELYKEVPLCKHCVCNLVDWEPCGKTPKLEDFAVND